MNSTYAKQVGKAIRRHRELAGISQQNLAEKVGVTVATLSSWKSGNTRFGPPIGRLLDISHALQVSILVTVPVGSK